MCLYRRVKEVGCFDCKAVSKSEMRKMQDHQTQRAGNGDLCKSKA